MAKVFGFGIVGAGVAFGDHAEAIRSIPNRARLIAVADTDEYRLRVATTRHFAPHTYVDYRQLLERDDIDVVTVATPPGMHEHVVSDALEAGKWVVCEKPLAHTLEAADRVIKTAVRYPGRLTVVYQLRFLKDARRIVWLRDNGWLGDLLFGRCTRLYKLTESPSLASGWWGRWEIAGGGAVITQCIHELDLLCHIFGQPVEVCATMDTLQQDIESEDTFAAVVRFDNKAVVACSSTVNAHHCGTTIDVIGRRASAHLPFGLHASDAEHYQRMSAAVRKVFPAPKPPGRSLPGRAIRRGLRMIGRSPRQERRPEHRRYIESFLDAIETQTEVPVNPAAARRSLELCTAIYASATIGTRVTLPLDESCVCYNGITADAYGH